MSEAFVGLLSSKLLSEQVIFFVGAGLSRNWGIPGGKKVAQWLVDRYRQRVDRSDPVVDRMLCDGRARGDLPTVAEVLARNKCWFLRNILYAPDDPPNGSRFFATADVLVEGDPVRDERIGIPHIVLGRLAKEGLIQEILTTNYDCLLEAGCLAVGMIRYDEGMQDDAQPWIMPWPEAFRVIAGPDDVLQLTPRRNVLYIYKIHGCIAALGRKVNHRRADQPSGYECNADKPCDRCDLTQNQFNFVITYRELLDWRRDHWARDLFHDRARTHHLVFVGFHGSDWVLHAALRSIFEEAWQRQVSDRDRAVPAVSPPEPHRPDAVSPELEAQAAPAAEAQLGSRSIRAQATEMAPNLFMRQILREAAGHSFDEDHQIWSLQDRSGSEHRTDDGRKAKARMVELFRSTYVETMKHLIQSRLEHYGLLWMETVLPPEGRVTLAVRERREALEQLKRVLYHLPVRVWYDALPAAVRMSWILSADQILPDLDLMRRLAGAHYYIPLGQNDAVTFPLLWFYAAAWSTPGVQCLGDGWILFPRPRPPNGSRGVAPLVFPLLALSRRHLLRRLTLPRPEIRPPRQLEQSALVKPVLVLIGSGESGAGRLLPAVAGVVGARPPLRIYSVPLRYEDLVRTSGFSAWLRRLYDELNGTRGEDSGGSEPAR